MFLAYTQTRPPPISYKKISFTPYGLLRIRHAINVQAMALDRLFLRLTGKKIQQFPSGRKCRQNRNCWNVFLANLRNNLMPRPVVQVSWAHGSFLVTRVSLTRGPPNSRTAAMKGLWEYTPKSTRRLSHPSLLLVTTGLL